MNIKKCAVCGSDEVHTEDPNLPTMKCVDYLMELGNPLIPGGTPSKKYRFILVLGDWSSDGHEKSAEYIIESNKEVGLFKQAYKDSCKKLGIQFNINDDYTGRNLEWSQEEEYRVCTEYEDNALNGTVRDILEKHSCPIIEELEKEGGSFRLSTDQFIRLLMWFICLSMPKDTEWKEVPVSNPYPYLNGFWDDDLNETFGYGLFV